MINVTFGNVRIEVLALNETEKKLIYHLDVRPGNLQDRLVFFGIESLPLWIHWWRYRPKQIFAKHIHNFWIHGVGNDLSIVCDIVEEFMKRQSLDFLGLHIRGGVVEIKDNVTLIDFLHEKFLAPIRWNFVETRQFSNFPLTLIRYIES